MSSSRARYSIGERVEHQLFGYRGVVVDVDPSFQLSDDWYDEVARSRPPKDEPWYHVLPHEGEHMTYVAERNLASDASDQPIRHPQLAHHFDEFVDGRYRSVRSVN